MIGNAGKTGDWLRSTAMAWDSDACLQWPFARNANGRGVTWRDCGSVDAHVVVCEAEHGPRPTPLHDAAHTCGQGHQGCVNRKHLRWDTKRNNMADKKRHGTHREGEAVKHKVKLTKEQAAYVLASKERGIDLAARFGVSQTAICSIRKGRNWKSACA